MRFPTSLFARRLALLLAAWLCGVGLLFAQEKAGKAKDIVAPSVTRPNDRGDKKNLPQKNVADAREAAALEFVREHHRELEELLDHLKTNQPKQYQAAIRELARVQERLAGAKAKDKPRYELLLEEWRHSSRAQLLAARAIMSPEDANLTKQLKEVLRAQNTVRRQILELDHSRTTERAKRLQAQIEAFDRESPDLVDRQLKALLGRPARETQPAATPSEKKKIKQSDVQ